MNKAITLKSVDPGDPCTVAATIIDCQGYTTRGIIIGTRNGPDTVINGLTITNCRWGRTQRLTPDDPGDDGYVGGDTWGGGIWVESGAGPTILNCIITNTRIRAGNASSGNDGPNVGDPIDPSDPDSALWEVGQPGGRGGDGGTAHGGGIYCGSYSYPTIRNCTISNCRVIGATGGYGGGGGNSDSGNDAADGGNGGNGGGAYGGGIYIGFSGTPTITDCTIIGCAAIAGDANDAGEGGDTGGDFS